MSTTRLAGPGATDRRETDAARHTGARLRVVDGSFRYPGAAAPILEHISIVMNTHYPAHALGIADQVLLLDHEHRARSGPVREVMDEKTLARVFGVEVCVGEVEHNGDHLTTVIPVRVL